MTYEVVWNDGALDSMAEIHDRRIQSKLFDLADSLADDPYRRSEPLTGSLVGYHSFHWSRWRIVFSVDEVRRTVDILVVGMRYEGKNSDIYRKAQRAVNQGLIMLDDEDERDLRNLDSGNNR